MIAPTGLEHRVEHRYGPIGFRCPTTCGRSYSLKYGNPSTNLYPDGHELREYLPPLSYAH